MNTTISEKPYVVYGGDGFIVIQLFLTRGAYDAENNHSCLYVHALHGTGDIDCATLLLPPSKQEIRLAS